MDHKKILTGWLKNLHSKVSNNSTVFTPEELGQKHLFHISMNTNIKEFVPRIGHRQGDSEDRTVPRICVAPSLLGCLIGYASEVNDFLSLASDGTDENIGYKGGYKIYAFEFNAAIRPNNKLVRDSTASDECWLVSFSPENSTYRAVNAGKVFFSKMISVGRSKEDVNVLGELYVEITLDAGVMFSKNIFLEKGYYCITGNAPRYTKSWETDKDFKVTPIDKASFMAAKGETAALLDYQTKAPSYTKW